MSENKKTPFVGYEYKEAAVPSEQVSLYIDCYASFGWEPDENVSASSKSGITTLRLKRDRKIINKMELTRLQRQFEACAREIQELERSRNTAATIWALAVGMIGTVFMAGSVFAVTHTPPIYWLCVLLAIPAFAGWISPYFLYRYKVRVQTQKVQPLIEEKQEEIYEVCQKAYALL
ncbi:MAG: hypothetical protein Q4F81_06985 [Eubacteriales bacterium]|nr:hypothetical protein [Eubacteriales bacterium]